MKTVIHFDKTSKRQDRGDGVIYLDFEDFQFPDQNWVDFIFLVLSGWNEALYEMIKEGNNTCILTMQDGRHAIQIIKQPIDCYIEFGEYDSFDDSFIKGGDQRINVEFEEIVKEILSQTKLVSEYIVENELDSDYTLALKNCYNKLKTV